MFSFGINPSRQVAATGRLYAAPDRQSSEGEASASESKTDQTNALVTEPHSSAPEASTIVTALAPSGASTWVIVLSSDGTVQQQLNCFDQPDAASLRFHRQSVLRRVRIPAMRR
jgi:hypothetical protein